MAPKLKKLVLNRETLRQLSEQELENLVGGSPGYPDTEDFQSAGWCLTGCAITCHTGTSG